MNMMGVRVILMVTLVMLCLFDYGAAKRACTVDADCPRGHCGDDGYCVRPSIACTEENAAQVCRSRFCLNNACALQPCSEDNTQCNRGTCSIRAGHCSWIRV